MSLLDKFSEKAEHFRVLNIRVLRDGKLLDSKDWESSMRRNQYSLSKSFTSAAVGFAVQEGLLSLNETLADAFPDEMPDQPSEYLLSATVRDLLTMCLGQDKSYLMGEDRPKMDDDDWVRYSLSRPFSDQPGTNFVYNNVGPYLAGILVQRRSGCDLIDYLMPRLFKPLHIRRTVWEVDPQGNTFGGGGILLTVDEIAKFIQLHLQMGQWEGRQILSADWVKAATSKQVDNHRQGYGYLFWMGRDETYRADGRFCQFAIAVPKKNAIVALNAECREQGALLRHIHESIISNL